ncbi:FecR domain-containing protein [Corticimicrobacter populi]|nr:FecR domain-containing protein [Corticimicrobacter populi]
MTASPSSPSACTDTPEQTALDWFMRSRNGLDNAQRQALAQWLAADPAHAQAYAEWQEDWDGLDTLPAQQQGALLASARNACQPPAAQRPTPHTGFWSRRWQLTALLASLIVALLLFQLPGTASPSFAHSYATLPGEQQTVELPDGSRIDLDTDTRINVALFDGHREVRLIRGQAMFQVAANSARPFIVAADAARITVVGTQFSVRNTPGQPGADTLQVAVASGHVRVAPEGDSWLPWRAASQIDLTAGQQLRLDTRQSTRPEPAIAADIGAWRNHSLSVDDTPLSHVLAEFARYGHPSPLLADPGIAALRITGTFDTQNMAGFYRLLPRILPVHVEGQNTGTPRITTSH